MYLSGGEIGHTGRVLMVRAAMVKDYAGMTNTGTYDKHKRHSLKTVSKQSSNLLNEG